MLRSLALVALLVAPAVAETRVRTSHQRERGRPSASTLRFGTATPTTQIERLSLSVRGSRATAILTLSTKSRVAQDASIELDVPAGAEVSFLAVTLGGQRRIAQLVNAVDARAGYEAIVSERIDPALLEWIDSTPTTDRLRLSVYPLTRAAVADVEIILTLPGAASLVLDPGPGVNPGPFISGPGQRVIPRIEIDVDGRKLRQSLARAVRIPLAIEAPAESPTPVAHVDRDTALFLDEPLPVEEVELVVERPRRDPPRGAFIISEECKTNALARSCMP